MNERHPLKKPITDQGLQKRLSKYNGIVNRMTPEQLDNELEKRALSTRLYKNNSFFLLITFFVVASGEIEIRRLRLKHYYKAQLTFGCENPLKMIEQHFEYIAVIDFEATCNANQGTTFPHEIIEFPIVLIDVKQQIIV